MPTILHKDIRPRPGDPDAGAHVLHYYTFVNEAAMNAGTDSLLGPLSFSSNDVGKVAQVGAAAPYSYYILADHVGPTWTPLGGGQTINVPLSATTDVGAGDVEVWVGSVWLRSSATLKAASKVLLGELGGNASTLYLRRFTGGTAVASWSNPGGVVAEVLMAGGVDIVVPADDWYDFYLVGTSPGDTAVLKGICLNVVS